MIHIYWHTSPTPRIERAAEMWREAGEEVTLWSPADLPELFSEIIAVSGAVERADRVRHGANVVRWHVLGTFGGIWADADVTPLRRLPLMPEVPWCAAIGPVPTPFLCGGPAGHDLWTRARAGALDHPAGTSPHASGGRLLARIAGAGELTLLPAARFSAIDAMGTPLPEPAGGRFTLHEWATSRVRRASGWRRR